MRSWIVVIALAAACKKEPSAEPKPGLTGSGSAAVAVADAGGADAARVAVELLRAVPATVRLSSQVKNKTIKPEHIVDGNLGTAWNSVTEDLVGAWIEITVPAGATVDDVRLTVGHTGKGAKGEDYFTMNPRIRKVSVLRDTKVVATHALDPEKRELQAIPVNGAGGTVRIRVDEIVPGSKKNWREACVSELEVWGAPPAGWTAPAKPLSPTVEVQAPAGTSAFASLCENLDQAKAEREASRRASAKHCKGKREPEYSQCMTDEPGDPTCGIDTFKVANLAAPWREAGVHCSTHDEIYGPTSCSIVIDVDGTLVSGPDHEFESAKADLDVIDATMEDVVPGGSPELVIRYTAEHDQLIVCTVDSCSEPIAVSGDGWKVSAKLGKSEVVLATDTGTPPPTALGKKPLVFK